ncbi:phage tail tape measure protein [Geminocystis sp. NIES-3709]|uniref:phage tail tape measure protein n=1 Tax=Geminocystis sp. NIES-3709 TaxID=1617448 RepID=UPI0005FCA187|nr:phage tail tape measure protein [Geminocystis sp. NIES-3709]BAQ65519.1 phage tail length tape-measure protein [Geminocystis sp. NIES-3709]
MTEAQLRVEIRADADQATGEINRLQSELSQLNQTTSGVAMGEQFQRVGGQMTAVGHNIVNTMSMVGGAIIGVASEYETALASFSRISGVADQELDNLGKEFINLSKEIPKSIPDLITIGEEASKIGVGKEGVIEFTKLVSQMSVAFDISAEETGEAVGKLAANFGMLENGIPDMKRLETLGNVVNNLGDSLAAGEAGIIEFVKRTAGLYKTAGITENELAAFGATMQDVGIVPETSARAFENFANVLAKGDGNTTRAQEGFKMLGLSMTEMQSMMLQGKGTEAMLQLFEAIKKTGPEAQIAAEKMFGEFGGEALRTANSANGATKSFEIMTNAMSGKGTTLEGGLNIMSATFESQMILLKNSLASLGIAIASSGLLEGLIILVKGFTEFISKVSEVNPVILKVGVALGVIVGIIGLLLIPLGSLVSIIGTIMTLSSAGIFAGLATAFTTATAGAIAFLAPLAPIVAIIIAIGVALIPVIMFIQQFVKAVQEFGIVSGLFMALKAVVTAVGQIIVGVFTGAVAAVVGFVGAVVVGIGSAVAAIVGGGLKIIAAIASWIEEILGVPPIFSDALNRCADIILGFVGIFMNAGKALMGALADGVKSSVGAVTGAISGAMDRVRSFLPFSDAKTGPLSDLTYSGASIPETLAQGVKGNMGVLETMMSYLPFPDFPIMKESPSVNNSSVYGESSSVTTNNNSSPVTVNITLNSTSGRDDSNFIEQLRAEGAEIARIVERAISERDRTKYVRA